MIRGWRRYEIVSDQQGVYALRGMYFTWYGPVMTARCIPMKEIHRPATRHPSEDVLRAERARCVEHLSADPGSDGEHQGEFGCGVYMVDERRTLNRVVQAYGFHSGVDAAVLGWGAYARYENGHRCQYVRVEHLTVRHGVVHGSNLEKLVGELEARYGVLVDVDDTPADDLRTSLSVYY